MTDWKPIDWTKPLPPDDYLFWDAEFKQTDKVEVCACVCCRPPKISVKTPNFFFHELWGTLSRINTEMLSGVVRYTHYQSVLPVTGPEEPNEENVPD